MHRQQFVQVDDKCSDVVSIQFGVPQGSILCPVLFNICVGDLQKYVSSAPTIRLVMTMLLKISDLDNCKSRLSYAIHQLSAWSKERSVAFNSNKTKVMIFSTPQFIQGTKP